MHEFSKQQSYIQLLHKNAGNASTIYKTIRRHNTMAQTQILSITRHPTHPDVLTHLDVMRHAQVFTSHSVIFFLHQT